SRMPRGSVIRMMLRADGAPPTTSVESSGAGGGSNRNVSKIEPRGYGLWINVVSIPLIESTFMNHAITAPQPFSRVQNEMVVGPSAPTRTPMPSLPLSPSTYGACNESSLSVTLSCLLVVSIPAESPVVASTPLGCASRLSRFTLRSGAPANAPCTSPKVVFESIVTGRRYSVSVWLCAAVSRRVTVKVILAESVPTSGLVVVSAEFRTTLAGRAVVTNTTRLSTTPGTSLAVMATARYGHPQPPNVE